MKNSQQDKKITSLLRLLQKGVVQKDTLIIPNLSDSQARFIADAICGSSLTSLILPYNRLSEEGVDVIMKSLPETKIIHLSVSNSGFNIDLLMSVIRLLPKTSVTSIDASHNIINDLSKISGGIREASISILNLSFNKLSNADGILLAKLVTQTSIQELDVRGNSGFNDSVTKRIEQSLQSKIVGIQI